jgi:transposase InsO family protein
MSQRRDFIALATAPGANISELCRRFGISRKTGNKWLARYLQEGLSGLLDRSRRPHSSPRKVPQTVEGEVLALRKKHPAWGGRKLRARLHALGKVEVPSASTITAILERNGQLDGQRREVRDWQRFEHDAPNRLWQMDFKGHFATDGPRCHPLTLLDDHSRFSLCLEALGNERAVSVRETLTEVFRRYGLPERILADNGAPWGDDPDSPHTILTVWLLRLGVKVSHGRPYHPQTQGKEERFHRTLNAEVLRHGRFRDLADAQSQFDRWRDIYNHERPHEALGLAVPASRYCASTRAFPESLPAVEYDSGEMIRRVCENGRIRYNGRFWRVGKAFRGLPVVLRPTQQDGIFAVYFCNEQVKTLDLRQPQPTP